MATSTAAATITPPQKDEEREEEEGRAAPPSPLPEFVYKITPTPPPDPIPEAYPLSDLDRKDGFVHLSTAWQVSTTALVAIVCFLDLFSLVLFPLSVSVYPVYVCIVHTIHWIRLAWLPWFCPVLKAHLPPSLTYKNR